ncbi:MAG: radical SAM protein [Candidatus Accumulibacter sp.]|jgi:radical SAM protein with 4Fe4S-binding SPASM domain|nr:radical SAM protein [Accumulibacter sp.]
MENTKKYHVSTAALHITYFCMHKCPMCYAKGEGQSMRHPKLSELIKIVDELATAGVQEVSLVGGDPASYPKIGELVKYIAKTGMKTSILSNTLSFENITPEEISQYIYAFEGTIHSDNAESHDAFCKQSGAYEKLVANLRKYKSLGKRIGVALNIHPQSVNKLHSIVKNLIVANETPLDYVIIQRIVPLGRAQNTSEFVLLKEQVCQALEEIERIDSDFGVEIVVEDPFPLCIISEKHWKYMNHRCAWGWDKVALNPKGDLSRCGADPRFLLGNLFETPLNVIWNESPILKSFRSFEYLPGRCQVCEHLQRCGGGCPLSCENDKDHSTDYLLNDYLSLNDEITGRLTFAQAQESDISDMLKIEWSNFSKYQHIFNFKSISDWYHYNPAMFYVVKDSNGNIFGYSVIVPMSETLYAQVRKGQYSSFVDFPQNEVEQDLVSEYYHLEVIATILAEKRMPVSGVLIKGIGELLVHKKAKVVTTSPMTDKGSKLSRLFGFKKVAEEDFNGEIYPIAELEISEDIKRKLSAF